MRSCTKSHAVRSRACCSAGAKQPYRARRAAPNEALATNAGDEEAREQRQLVDAEGAVAQPAKLQVLRLGVERSHRRAASTISFHARPKRTHWRARAPSAESSAAAAASPSASCIGQRSSPKWATVSGIRRSTSSQSDTLPRLRYQPRETEQTAEHVVEDVRVEEVDEDGHRRAADDEAEAHHEHVRALEGGVEVEVRGWRVKRVVESWRVSTSSENSSHCAAERPVIRGTARSTARTATARAGRSARTSRRLERERRRPERRVGGEGAEGHRELLARADGWRVLRAPVRAQPRPAS